MSALPKKIHFIGIGGAGMAPLATLARQSGCQVSGSDREPNAKCRALSALGVQIFRGHAAENLPPDCQLVVYSSAVASSNPERQVALHRTLPQLRRGEFLAQFSQSFARVTAISGSHGKSSITAMLTRIMERTGAEPGFLIGASRPDGPAASLGHGHDIFITEADESDATHKLLAPYLGVIPNFDGDHEWSVGGAAALRENFRIFAQRCQIVLAADLPELHELLTGLDNVRFAPLPAPGTTYGEFHGYFALNAALAVQAAEILGCPEPAARQALQGYPGIERRMCERFRSADLTVYEDYAHHPTEVRQAIALLRERFPHTHLRILFQPHRYARLERFFTDFVATLSQADSVVVTPVFAAWSETGTCDAQDLVNALPHAELASGDWGAVAHQVLQGPRPLLIAVLGAGDVEQVFHYLHS